METVYQINSLRMLVAGMRKAAQRVALVPTMGNLHLGHLRLVEAAKSMAQRSVVSIFVNPMQFGPNEDLHSYPRTLEEDSRQLVKAGLDILFAPSVVEIYPQGIEGATRVEVSDVSDILCGASRPGHFAGVATVVTKLLNIVQPDIALFGEKDWQQLVVIRRLVADLNMPIEIVGVPTVREADGLAMSSRNRYLSPSERAIAPILFATLQKAAEHLRSGKEDYAALEMAALKELEEAGLRSDYVTIRRADDLQTPDSKNTNLRILAAAWLGSTRLIDNCPVILDSSSKF
jgi:pantoate--beta-alanine ligase